jgi:hypothetical protein
MLRLRKERKKLPKNSSIATHILMIFAEMKGERNYPKLSEGPDDASTAVLDEGARNDLERGREGAVRELLNAGKAASLFAESDGDRHLGRTAAGAQPRLVEQVAGNHHRILKVAVYLVENVLGRSAQNDGAGLGLLAVVQEGKVPVSERRNIREKMISVGKTTLLKLQMVTEEEKKKGKKR